jgi:hypothetical protein
VFVATLTVPIVSWSSRVLITVSVMINHFCSVNSSPVKPVLKWRQVRSGVVVVNPGDGNTNCIHGGMNRLHLLVFLLSGDPDCTGKGVHLRRWVYSSVSSILGNSDSVETFLRVQ